MIDSFQEMLWINNMKRNINY